MPFCRIVRSHDLSTFLERTGPFLYAHEPKYHAIVSVTEGLARGLAHKSPPVLVHAEGTDQIIGVVVAVDSRVLITEWPEENVAHLEQILLQLHQRGRNLIGPTSTVDRLIGYQFHSITEQRALSTDRIHNPEVVPGGVRLANTQDISLVSQWLRDYSKQSRTEIKAEANQTRQFLMNQVSRQLVYLWCVEGRPVSMAQLGRATKNGISITAVFTPECHRGRGYASNLVAEVSQRMLKRYRFCVLRTEATNKTSNKIYQAIGYEPVAEFKSCYF